MKHYIIVKYSDRVSDKDAFSRRVEALYAPVPGEVEGVHAVTVKRNAVDIPNRYDLMIVLDMERDAIPVWSSSRIHREWKENWAVYIEKKCIFDSED